VALEDVRPKNEHRLRQFIERYAHVSAGEKLFAKLTAIETTTMEPGTSIGVKVRKIGRNKVLVESELGLEPGAECEIELSLGGRDFKALAHVVFIEKREEVRPEQRHWIGAELTAIDPSNQEILQQYIRERVSRLKLVKPAASSEDRSGVAAGPPADPKVAAVRGNVKSKIFHTKDCRNFTGRDCTDEFADSSAATAAGYRPCRLCSGRGD
jgi:hypothetical protein